MSLARIFLASALFSTGCGAHAAVRAGIDIAAPPEIVWGVLIDTAGYPAWNPFTTRVDGALRAGEEIVLTVQLVPGKKPRRQQQRVLERVEQARIIWETRVGGRHTLVARRTQRLIPIDGGTRYLTEDAFSGGLTPLVMSLYRKDLERGFEAMTSALKARAEQVQHEGGGR